MSTFAIVRPNAALRQEPYLNKPFSVEYNTLFRLLGDNVEPARELLGLLQHNQSNSANEAELSVHDLKIESLIQILIGTAPTAPPHVNHTPAAFVISPTHIHGNQYNLSGDFRGAIVNVASVLEGVVQHIQAATLELAVQAELIQLLRMLRRALEDAPATHTHAAEAVAATIATVIGTAFNTEPSVLSTVATNCALAAAQLDSVLPEVSKLAAAIVAQAKLIRQ